MYLCYMDESGTPDLPGNTSHYVQAGLSIPDEYRSQHDVQIERVKRRYGLEDVEVHVGWVMERYLEQQLIPGFESMPSSKRRSEVRMKRHEELLRLQRVNRKGYKQTKNNYDRTEPYVHLTLDERKQAIREVAEVISSWGVVRPFAECIDKLQFDPAIAGTSVHGQAFEQVVSRFERYLQNRQTGYGLRFTIATRPWRISTPS